MKNGKYAKRRGVASKTFALVVVMMLVIGCTIGGTIAWLTATSGPVTNTFTVGDINITLAETTESSFKIVPGGTSAKDPTVTVKANSENCYVYVTVDNTVRLGGTIVATPNISDADWLVVQTAGSKTLYRYKEIVSLKAADQKLPVFTSVAYSDSITKSDINTLNGTKIIINAFAHQSDNAAQNVADSAAIAWAFPTP